MCMSEPVSREEHLKWCKEEALKVLAQPNKKLSDVLASLFHNFEKHKATKSHLKMGEIFFHMNNPAQLDTPGKMKRYINELE